MSQVRVSFFDADSLVASVWVAKNDPANAAPVAAPTNAQFGARIEGKKAAAPPLVAPANIGPVTLTLLHDYPDLAPQAGWTVTGRSLDLTITAVNGLTLTCRENK